MLRKRIAMTLNGAANAVDDFPGNALRALRTNREAISTHLRQMAHRVCPKAIMTKPVPVYQAGTNDVLFYIDAPWNAEVFHGSSGCPIIVTPTTEVS